MSETLTPPVLVVRDDTVDIERITYYLKTFWDAGDRSESVDFPLSLMDEDARSIIGHIEDLNRQGIDDDGAYSKERLHQLLAEILHRAFETLAEPDDESRVLELDTSDELAPDSATYLVFVKEYVSAEAINLAKLYRRIHDIFDSTPSMYFVSGY